MKPATEVWLAWRAGCVVAIATQSSQQWKDAGLTWSRYVLAPVRKARKRKPK